MIIESGIWVFLISKNNDEYLNLRLLFSKTYRCTKFEDSLSFNKLILKYYSNHLLCWYKIVIHFCFLVVFMIKALWMCGMTPPPAIVALIKVSSSSSPLIASCKCLGVILFTLRSFDALPASSRTSAVRYSRMAALYTAEVAPTLLLALTLLFKNLWILPTGNYNIQNWLFSNHSQTK